MEIAGRVQKRAGRFVGSKKAEAEGRELEMRGRAEREAAEAKERVKGRAEEVAGRVQKKVGRAVGDAATEAKGTVRRAKGKLRRKANR